jgi:hypothetical protein
MGSVILSKVEDQIILKGYIKSNLIKVMSPFHPILGYSSNNEEYYFFNSKKLHSIISLLNKHSVSYIDQTLTVN